ncbi:MAG: hypothetical protein ACC641_11115 [Acidiferrobacterales bacterium]
MEKHLQIKATDGDYNEVFILGEEGRELYVESVAKAAEIFGNESMALRTITHLINPKKALGCQFFWLTHLNACLPQHQTVISLEQMELTNDANKKYFDGLYVYVPEIILRNETPATRKERFILAELVTQVKQENYEFSPEIPLRISGLKMIKDKNPENPYGLLLKFGDGTKVCIDKRFACSKAGKNIEFGVLLKNIWTCGDGLSTICLGGGTSLYAEGGFSIYPDCVSRVVIADAHHLPCINPGSD